MHVQVPLAKVQEMLAEIDINNDGEVDFDEFVACVKAARTPSKTASGGGGGGAFTRQFGGLRRCRPLPLLLV